MRRERNRTFSARHVFDFEIEIPHKEIIWSKLLCGAQFDKAGSRGGADQ